MDGGGGRKGTNYLYRNSRPDGLTIGAISGGVIALQIMRESGVLYDIDKFSYLGSPESVNHYTIYSQKRTGFDQSGQTSRRLRDSHRRAIGRPRFLYRRPSLCLLFRIEGS